MSTFTGQIVLVTGAGAGIGAAIAEELGLQGATVAINYIQNKTRAESVAANIKDSGGNAMAVQGDVESEASVEAMLKTMALELAPAGIRVNTIAPSLTQTPGSSWVPDESIEQTIADTPLGRLCTPEDIAKAVAMIASDDLSFITGAYIPVNGGLQLG